MQPKKILLAEDDHDDSNLFHEYLKGREDIVLMPTAENGIEVIKFLDKIVEHTDLPDLIILDQNMPKKNGKQTLVFLKSNNRFAHIPVIVYSTYTDDQLIKDCTKKGASMVVSKPLTNKGYHDMMDGFLKVL